MSNIHLISNRYRIGKLLSEGGMGAVYRGEDTQSGVPVAIKLLKPEKVASQPDKVERFSREADALRILNHPNIVKVLATVTEGDNHYIIMEYVRGGSLRDLLDRDGQLPITRTLELVLDLADALTRAHRLDIIHRDLKPANVLLADDGTPRLSDFGLAKVGGTYLDGAPGLTQTGTIMGTIDYLSPEACRGEVLDARTDIWALGGMLFEMLVGRRPFPNQPTSTNIAAILSAILTQPVPDLEVLRPGAPDALVDLVYRMLTKERDARIPSMRLVGAELEIIIQGIEADLRGTAAEHIALPRFTTPTPHPTGVPHHNLPEQTTPFIGREAELANLANLITGPDNRLITILGPGGVGKTRLALESARAQLPNFGSDVTFVPLAPLSSAESIILAIAEAIGLPFFDGMEPREQLFDFFREKQALLVLDNFEHILDGADLVRKILRAAPGVIVLATSREKLNLLEEVRFRIDGMDFPKEIQPTSLDDASRYSAIRLFTKAAKRARPSFELKMKDLKHITRICHLVRGMPLGILLAAAWVEMFSPMEIADEIGQSLDFLETDARDIPERHRSIRAVFDSSWDQMSAPDRETFMKLSVFRGGFRREAAQVVTGASLRNLISLVSKSLLHRDPTSGRYEVHELLRQYAEAQLESSGKFNTARNAHCAFYTALLEERLGAMLGPRQVKALDEIAAEFRNVRQAWNWAVEKRDYASIDQASESLFVFSDMRSREYEGVDLLRLALDRLAPQQGEEPHPAWGRLLLPWYDLMVQSKGRPENTDEIKAQTEINLALARKNDDPLGIAHGLLLMGHFNKPAIALEMYEQVLDLVPRLDDSFWVRIRIGYCHRSMGEYQGAIQAFWQSHARGRKIGENEKMGWSLFNIGETEILLGDLENAETRMRAAINHFCQVGTSIGIIGTNINLSLMMLLKGDIQEARSLVEEAQEIARDTNRPSAYQKEVLIILGYQALVEEDHHQARNIFEEILSNFDTTPEAYLGMTYAAYGLEDFPNAIQHLRDALQSSSLYRIPVWLTLCIPAAALILMHEGEVEKATELLALAFHHPASPAKLLAKWPLITHLSDKIEAELTPMAFDKAWTRGQASDLTEALSMLANHFQTEAHPHQLDKVKPFLPTRGEQSLVEPLSDREMEILQLLKTELSGPEIARELMVSLNTVRFHTKNIYSKLQVNNRRSAVNRAFELGL